MPKANFSLHCISNELNIIYEYHMQGYELENISV